MDTHSSALPSSLPASAPSHWLSPALSFAPQKKIVIAIDGPAASGKGTLARKIAARLGYAYLETGALYRAVAMTVIEMGGNPSKLQDVEPALAIVQRNLTPELLANPDLRREDVAQVASKVSALPLVRQKLLDFQRDFALNPPGNVGGAVLDGRDIGTVVCPDADVKLFLTANVEARAERRWQDLRHTAVTFEDVLTEMKERDLRDSSRATAPAKAAADAYVIDTTAVSADEVLEESIAVVKAKFLAETAGAGG